MTAERSNDVNEPPRRTSATTPPPVTRPLTGPQAQTAQHMAPEIEALWHEYAEARSIVLRERLILQYAPLVKYVIGRLAISLPAILDYEDILSYGTIGLIEAVERYDATKGVKFETYAISRVRGSIIDALRSLDRLPRSVRQKARVAEQTISRLTAGLGREPSDQEVADALDITLERYLQNLVDASWVTVSIDSIGPSEDEDGPMELPLADPDAEEVSAGLEREEQIRELTNAIGELPEREQLVLSLYYKDELTMREISKVLGVSESRVCQLHARALTRLRTGLAAAQGEAA